MKRLLDYNIINQVTELWSMIKFRVVERYEIPMGQEGCRFEAIFFTYNWYHEKASPFMTVVNVSDSQSSNLGSNPVRGHANLEWDDNALKAFLREPPCRTCKMEQASIRLQDYL